ncbi:MAG: putative bifunctional diguanylate cyclase/phosphodiesterase [Beijerinckiaceae bacterium]
MKSATHIMLGQNALDRQVFSHADIHASGVSQAYADALDAVLANGDDRVISASIRSLIDALQIENSTSLIVLSNDTQEITCAIDGERRAEQFATCELIEIAPAHGAAVHTFDASNQRIPVAVAMRALALGFRACVAAAISSSSGRRCGVVVVLLRHPLPDGHPCIVEIAKIGHFATTLMQTREYIARARKADTQLAGLAATVPGVLYQRVVRPNGEIRYTYISENAVDLFGVTAERILTDPEALFQSYSADYRQSFRQKLLQASKDLTLWDVEATIVRPDGKVRYTHAIAKPTREPDGSVIWTGVILDATRIKEAELMASAAETRTRKAIVESLSQGLLMFNKDDVLTVKNSHFDKLYPALADIAVPGAKYIDLLHAELNASTNPHVLHSDIIDELTDRLTRHGHGHLVYERAMAGDRFILVNEYRTPELETVVLYTDISELKMREKRIEHLAHHDVLTGLANRVLFRSNLEHAIFDAAQHQLNVAVLCLDLDRFKSVNDTLGHHVGDLLLKQVAQRIRDCVREDDLACRLGGDEFAIIMRSVNDPLTVTTLAWRLLQAMAQPFTVDGHTIVSGTSIGIAIGLQDGDDPDGLLKNADLALYRAKSDGRGTFRFFEAEMDQKAQTRRLLEISLRAAVVRQEIEVHYQPLVDVHTAQIVGVEALVRWNRMGAGYIPPLEFIPLAEETGLINDIGIFVLKKACADAAKWPNDIRVAVNISPAQFRNTAFASVVKGILEQAGLSPNRLELEITESMLLRNSETNLAILRELKEQGIRISMDDFGTGYSSLGNLRSFPFDKIKIDKSFIGDLNKSVDAAAIIRAVLSLGRSLGMTTTAEGVETRDQLAYLRAEGCVEVQGHYYASAMNAKGISTILENSNARVMLPASQSM